LIKSSSFKENYFASIGGYSFEFKSVLNLPNGSRVAPYRMWENNVELTLHGILPSAIALSFASLTASV